jgi:hypothetical protein
MHSIALLVGLGPVAHVGVVHEGRKLFRDQKVRVIHHLLAGIDHRRPAHAHARRHTQAHRHRRTKAQRHAHAQRHTQAHRHRHKGTHRRTDTGSHPSAPARACVCPPLPSHTHRYTELCDSLSVNRHSPPIHGSASTHTTSSPSARHSFSATRPEQPAPITSTRRPMVRVTHAGCVGRCGRR